MGQQLSPFVRWAAVQLPSGGRRVSPTILRLGSYRFFFNSREETRRHVHVATTNGIAKFRLEPIVALASFHSLDSGEPAKLDHLVREHEHEFRFAWDRRFSQ